MPLLEVDDYIDAKLTHSIHTSQRKSFRGCRVRHNWLFNDYYYPRTTAKPLEFGSGYHTGLECYFHPELWTKPRDIVLEMAIQAFRNECEKQLREYKATLADGDVPDEVLADYKERKELGEGMLRYFHTTAMDDPIFHHLRPIKVEIPFEVPIYDPDTGNQLWCTCNDCFSRWLRYQADHGMDSEAQAEARVMYVKFPERWKGLPVTYGGRIDAILEGPDGRIWVFDWKTAAQLAAEQDRTEFLALDDQITSYCMALWLLGIRVAGFVYFEQKKAFPQEPEPLVRPRLGRSFSVSKQNSFDYATYKRTVEELDTEAYEAGLYDEFLTYLKEEGGSFHHWYKEYRTPAQMLFAQQEIYDEACDITDPKTRIYKNAGRFNCGSCAFRQPCLERSAGRDPYFTLNSPSLYEKREYHYWEKKKPSTDTKGGE